ncbi:hypothetical protein NL529_34560, partial [Klebsiella pneumoniae]|nr:hypothetical protein [Klebsiella pneumoniae]
TAQANKHILETCKKHKVAAGYHCTTAEEAKHRIAEGWQFIAIASELKMMLNGAGAIVQGLGGDRPKSELAKY